MPCVVRQWDTPCQARPSQGHPTQLVPCHPHRPARLAPPTRTGPPCPVPVSSTVARASLRGSAHHGATQQACSVGPPSCTYCSPTQPTRPPHQGCQPHTQADHAEMTRHTPGASTQPDTASNYKASTRRPAPVSNPSPRRPLHLSTLQLGALRIRHLSAHMPEAFELCGWVRVLFTSSLGPASNARKGRTPPGQQKGHNFPNPESDTRRAKDQDEQNPRWTRTTRRCELTRHRNPLGH